MLDIANIKIEGHILAKDKDTGIVVLDVHNDVLYGNLSTVLAHALIGNPSSFLFYMAFGNGGAYVGPTGLIQYKDSKGGPNSLIKDPTANLYNTIYVKKMSNDTTPLSSYNELSNVYIPGGNDATNYEDVISRVSLEYNEPGFTTTSGYITQSEIDNSSFIGTSETVITTVFNPGELVFNEIGLFAGTSNLFPNDSTQTIAEVNSFIEQTTNFSRDSGTKSKTMITHSIFHPTQKAANRALEFIYTLRIQMGTNV
jgi:hypothetical protein